LFENNIESGYKPEKL